MSTAGVPKAAPGSDATVYTARPAADVAGNERATWLTGAALSLALLLIASLLVTIGARGLTTFWPGPIDRVDTARGETFLGVPVETERVEPSDADLRRMAELGVDAAEKIERTRYLVGNRDLGQQSFRWLPVYEVEEIDRPGAAALIERDEWGVFLGIPRAVIVRSESGARERVAEGPEETIAWLEDGLDEAAARRAAIEHLNDTAVPRIESRLAQLRWKERGLERRAAKDADGHGLPTWAWLGVLAGLAATLGSLVRVVMRGANGGRKGAAVGAALSVATVGLALAAVLEHPWAGMPPSEARVEAVRERIAEERSELEAKREQVLRAIRELREEDERYRLVVEDPRTGRIAPASKGSPDSPMRVSQAQRVVLSNQLGLGGKLGTYLGRWWSFLSRPPGETADTGGVWPAVLGTVVLTVLLTVVALPFGVIAALYLREYAKQGPLVSAVRIAINNLAGVPSIVYGMFGLGFFCYAVGEYVDGGPQAPAATGVWWWVRGGPGLVVTLAASLMAWAGGSGGLAKAGRWATGVLWILAIAGAGWLIASTPYFGGFFSEKLPEQSTFGGRGMLWASLTLALLTLPVVIVSTEEAIAAVPNSMREGSYGCGASRWQTVRKIVLPSALPGILTGAILAMARGAGEVAPLLLVGAVNHAPAPPVSGEAPFMHLDRTFMHMAFQIYQLSAQSPDADATEPMVWTTTLVLVAIVVALNLAAVIIRARLKSRHGGTV